MKVQVIITSLSIVAFCGCSAFASAGMEGENTKQNADGANIVADIAKIDKEDGVDIVRTHSISDENFSYTMGDEHSRSFKMLNPKASLNDLNDFAIAKCWNGYLRPKLQNAQALTREDAVLLDFCINVQLNMVDTLAVVSLGDMTSPGFLHSFVVKEAARSQSREKDLEGIYRDQNRVFVDLKMNFLNSNEGIRVPMQRWAGQFKAVSPEILKRIFVDIKNATGTVHSSNASTFKEDLRLWFRSSAGPVIRHVCVAGAAAWYISPPDKPNEIERGAMAMNVPAVEMKSTWRNAKNAMTSYLDEMRNMRQELKSIRMSGSLQDPKTRRYLQRILTESDNDSTAVARYLDYAMYDMPFSVLTYKVSGQLKECKGRFNDDKEKMKKVMSEYCQAVAGTEMLKHIRTRYAANGYLEVVTRLKDELSGLFSDDEWKNFLIESKLYNIDQKVDRTGRQNNDLEPVK